MGSEERECPACATRIPAAFPPGWCPACMLAPTEVGNSERREPSSVLPESEVDEGTGETGDDGNDPGSASSTEESGSVFDPPDVEAIGERFPEFDRWGLVRTHASSVLYRGRDRRRGGVVLLELVRLGSDSGPPDSADREIAGLRSGKSLEVAGVLGVRRVVSWETGARPLMAVLTDTVGGRDLRSALDFRELTRDRIVEIVCDLCATLQRLRDRGRCPARVLPETIFLEDDGSVLLAPIGLVAPASDGEREASEISRYDAPETWDDASRGDIRSSIYSLGALLEEWFENDLSVPVSTPAGDVEGERLESAAYRARERDPERRFQTPAKLVEALEVSVGPVPPLPAEPVNRARWPWILAGSGILVLFIWMMARFLPN